MFLQISIAVLYISLCVVFTPFYVKLIHVFITNKKYKFLKAYKLMTQIGVVQCASCPAFIMLGYSIAVGYDPHNIASFLIKIMNGCRRAEAFLSVALGLERFQTIFRFQHFRFLVDGLIIVAWLYGLTNIALFNSPLSEFAVVPEKFGPAYNRSFPATAIIEKVNFCSSVTASVTTFLLYLLIVGHLLHQKLSVKTFQMEVNEKSIFIQAFVRFFGDTAMSLMYHVVPLLVPKSTVLQITTTLGYIVNSLVLPPVLSMIVSRVLYIFLIKKQYRSLQCYQIMIQIGIVQCLMGPAWMLLGLSGLLDYDPLGMASFLVDINASCLRIEAGLSFLLALDRIKIVCKVNYPQVAIVVANALIWIYGILQFAILQTPWADLYADPFLIAPIYDFSFPYTVVVQKTAYFYSIVISFITFVLYVVMVIYLFRQQRKVQHVGADFNQRWIFTQALIRYILDAILVAVFFLGPSVLPKSIWIAGAMMTGYVTNNLFIPPMLYVCLNKTLRQEVFKRANLRPRGSLALSCLAWTYGFVYFTILCSPFADLTVIPSQFKTSYDMSLPVTPVLQKIGTDSTLICAAVTFLLYLVVVCYLVHQKLKMKTIKISFNEKAIFVQAFLRFVGDTTMTVLYHFIPPIVGDSSILSVSTFIGYIVNYLVLPPILCIIVSRHLRKDVLSIISWNSGSTNGSQLS
ncbi:hypothetical protein QR680_010166 [Steinernema hermaphroditum]|uniref:Uncharacterized protein n=1 Tax=Steinernema hermaphroditum TaxID=289476 RepID=A0AA39IPW9_9BILA|nr:hypothetical protein QR680_010166 [Steinernema hermaphroditum]